jgi:BlaI family transcriptional regulator, penicillinase repressor
MKETLTYSEWMVMSAMWGKPPQTLSEVIKNMSGTMDWNYRTYSTYLRLLCQKGFVGFDSRVRDKLYYPLVGKEQCIRAESQSLIQKVSKKSTKDLLVCLIQESDLSPEDHADLQKLLEELAKRSD